MILHGKQIVILKSLSGETTLACILPVPLSLGRNQRHVLAHNDVDTCKSCQKYTFSMCFLNDKNIKKLSEIYALNAMSSIQNKDAVSLPCPYSQ